MTTARGKLLRRALGFGVLAFMGCATGPFAEETVGERFRKALAEIDQNCRERKLGPYLDPSDPEYRRKQALTNCDILKLEPRDWRTEKMVQTEGQHYPIPERWLATPEGRFAHSIRLPAPHDKSKAVYRAGMTGREYFEALCREEAGEFVIHRASDVVGVAQERSVPPLPRAYSTMMFFVSEPGPTLGTRPAGFLVGAQPLGFTYVDERQADANYEGDWQYRRYIRADAASPAGTRTLPAKSTSLIPEPSIREELADRTVAAYGFTFRGIRRPEDWEHGIEGREVIVYQLAPLNVLGVKRSFRRIEPDDARADRRSARASPCPATAGKWDLEHSFIFEVLRPKARD